MIRREIKAYIEAELRDFNDTLRQIGEERNEILLASPVRDNNGGHSYDVGNPTMARSFQLMTNKRIKHMEQTCKAIENIVGELPEEKFKLVELKYWTRPQTLTDMGIAIKLNISQRTYYNWKDAIILALAIELGLVDEVELQKDCSLRGSK